MNHVHIDDLESFIETAILLSDTESLETAVRSCQDFLPRLYLSKHLEAVQKHLAGNEHEAHECEMRADEYALKFREMLMHDEERALVMFEPALRF